MGYAFISYSSKNQGTADAIRKLLLKIRTGQGTYVQQNGTVQQGRFEDGMFVGN